MLVVLQVTLSASAAAKQPECSLLIFCQVQNHAGCHVVVDPVVLPSIDSVQMMHLTVKNPSMVLKFINNLWQAHNPALGV